MRYILFLFVFVYSFSGISQVKYEKERRVKVEEVPSEALNFMQEFLPEKKVKWFYEEGTFGNSYETKFKKNGFKYSIEFDTIGKIQDVEIIIQIDEIEGYIYENIKTTLNQILENYSIQKSQIQYVGNIYDLLSLNDLKKAHIQQLGIAYELVVKGKIDGEVKLIEFNFSQTGDLIHQSELHLQNFDNLEY